MTRSGRFVPPLPRPVSGAIRPRRVRVPLAECIEHGTRPHGAAAEPKATTAAQPPAWANLTLADIAAARAQIEPMPPPSAEALEAAARLGAFALGVPCCAGALPGGRIRVVALEPVTPLDLGVARLKLERWAPAEVVEVIDLAAAGRWAVPGRDAYGLNSKPTRSP